jgi:hypothetical protein
MQMAFDFWLCDLETALADIRKCHGHLGMVAEKVLPIPNGFAFFMSSGTLLTWNADTRKIIISDADWRSE